MRNLAIISTVAASVIAGQAQALGLSDCRRITHVSHGGEYGHRDLGEGRVIWTDWWTQEGSFKGFSLVDCASGETLRFRTAEENMGRRAAFDRTDDAREVLERHQSGRPRLCNLRADGRRFGKHCARHRDNDRDE